MAILLNFLLVFTLTVFEFIAQIILGEKKKKTWQAFGNRSAAIQTCFNLIHHLK